MSVTKVLHHFQGVLATCSTSVCTCVFKSETILLNTAVPFGGCLYQDLNVVLKHIQEFFIIPPFKMLCLIALPLSFPFPCLRVALVICF